MFWSNFTTDTSSIYLLSVIASVCSASYRHRLGGISNTMRLLQYGCSRVFRHRILVRICQGFLHFSRKHDRVPLRNSKQLATCSFRPQFPFKPRSVNHATKDSRRGSHAHDVPTPVKCDSSATTESLQQTPKPLQCSHIDSIAYLVILLSSEVCEIPTTSGDCESLTPSRYRMSDQIRAMSCST